MKSMIIAMLLLAVAVPAAAQTPPPAAQAPRRGDGNPMFAGMSDAGRAAMRAAMRGSNPHSDQAVTAAARDRMLAVLDAEALDPVKLKRAMDDEREAATTAKVRRQAAMAVGFQQLSAADRHAFVANARAMRERMDGKVARWKERGAPGTPFGGLGGQRMQPPPPQ